MDRSFFRRSSRDTSPLLPQHSSLKSIPLADLPPRPYSESTSSPSRRPQTSASPLPASRPPHVQFSYPPPPIVGSVLLNVPQAQKSRSMSSSVSHPQINSTVQVATNPFLSLSRRERAIQSELQLLLDAQSVGLAQGRIGGQHGDDRSSDAGSSTPTTRSMVPSPNRGQGDRSGGGSRGVVPVRQPRMRKIGLKAARKGILGSMEELRALKEHEGAIMEEEMVTIKSLLSQVKRWEKKISSFEQEMRRINDGAGSREMSELKTESSAVQTEIRELEERLLNLRARERHLSRKIEEVENRAGAEMSSFHEGRRGVESEVSEFLKRPPVLEVSLAIVTNRDVAGLGERGGFLSLVPKRRTLEMAKDWLSANLNTLSLHSETTEMEKQALEEGAAMWSTAASHVTRFEEELRLQMKDGKQLDVHDLRQQLDRMGVVVRDLQAKAQEAEEKGWNLLICAIGAELEAFKEGEGLLRGVMATLDPNYAEESHNLDMLHLDTQTSDLSGTQVEFLKNSNGNQSSINEYDDAREEPLILERDDSGGIGVQAIQRKELERRDSSPYRSGTESEDDGPPAALLVGVQDQEDG